MDGPFKIERAVQLCFALLLNFPYIENLFKDQALLLFSGDFVHTVNLLITGKILWNGCCAQIRDFKSLQSLSVNFKTTLIR